MPRLKAGLTHGGTIDKLEAIPGYQTDVNVSHFQRSSATVGLHCAPTDELALGTEDVTRDVTATVENLGLIAASIVSALARVAAHRARRQMRQRRRHTGSSQGHGAGGSMVAVGNGAGMNTSALADMSVPRRSAGNAVEVRGRLTSATTVQGTRAWKKW